LKDRQHRRFLAVQCAGQAELRIPRFEYGWLGNMPAPPKNAESKGERVEIFQRSVLKNTTRTLLGA